MVLSPVITWKLKTVMADRDISTKELAARLGVNRVTVSRWRAFKTMPSIDGEKLEQLCKALNCEPWDLIKWVEEVKAG